MGTTSGASRSRVFSSGVVLNGGFMAVYPRGPALIGAALESSLRQLAISSVSSRWITARCSPPPGSRQGGRARPATGLGRGVRVQRAGRALGRRRPASPTSARTRAWRAGPGSPRAPPGSPRSSPPDALCRPWLRRWAPARPRRQRSPSGSDGAPGSAPLLGHPGDRVQRLGQVGRVRPTGESATAGSMVPSSPATMRPAASAFRTAVCETPRCRA